MHALNIDFLQLEYTLVSENPEQFYSSKAGHVLGGWKHDHEHEPSLDCCCKCRWSPQAQARREDRLTSKTRASRRYVGLVMTCHRTESLSAASLPSKKQCLLQTRPRMSPWLRKRRRQKLAPDAIEGTAGKRQTIHDLENFSLRDKELKPYPQGLCSHGLGRDPGSGTC